MMYLVFAVLFLHISIVPIAISIDIDIDSDSKMGNAALKILFVPIFVKRLSADDIKKFVDHEKGSADGGNKKKKSAFKNALKKFAVAAIPKLLSRIRTRDMYLSCMIGTGDGFSTAMTVSTVKIIYSQLCAYLDYSCSTSGTITPNYDDECIFVRYYGIFSLCFADIIYVMLCAFIDVMTRGKVKRRKTYAHNNVAE